MATISDTHTTIMPVTMTVKLGREGDTSANDGDGDSVGSGRHRNAECDSHCQIDRDNYQSQQP